MINMVKDIQNFHEKFGVQYDGKPRTLPEDLMEFRLKFMMEELNEYVEAHEQTETVLGGYNQYQNDKRDIQISTVIGIETGLHKQLDALVDLIYVVLGTAHLQGFDFEAAWADVHGRNMAKVKACIDNLHTTQDSGRHIKYDIVKPNGWYPPDHRHLVKDNIHQLELFQSISQ